MIEPVETSQTRETLDRAIADDHEAAHLRGQLDQLRSEAGVARDQRLADLTARRDALLGA